MRNILLICCALLPGCATSSPLPDPAVGYGSSADREAVVAVAEALFSAMRTRDGIAVARLFAPEARVVSIRSHNGELQIRSTPASDFSASIARSTDELRERIWNPRVEIHGELASLWAPYDFHRGDRFSHCGHDAFHLVRSADDWKIVALTYTVRTVDCHDPAPPPV